jgi:NDP-sugar pyrophosphorylase family protein
MSVTCRKLAPAGKLHLPALRKGTRLGSLAIGEPFVDVGTLASYLEANLTWLGTLGSTTSATGSFVAPGAKLDEGVRALTSVVGEGARVSADIDKCVVFPGTHVTAHLTRAIATPFGNFPVDVA